MSEAPNGRMNYLLYQSSELAEFIIFQTDTGWCLKKGK